MLHAIPKSARCAVAGAVALAAVPHRAGGVQAAMDVLAGNAGRRGAGLARAA